MKRLILVLALFMSGCSMLPNFIAHPFGTPAQKAAKAEKRVDLARHSVEEAVVLDIQGARYAISLAAPSRETRIAEDFLDEATQYAAKNGVVPNPVDVKAIQKVVDELRSDNEKIRARAERDRADLTEALSEKTDQLTELKARKDVAEKANAEYQRTTEHQAGIIRWLVLAAIVAGGVWVLAQVVHVVAMFNPSFAVASGFLHGILAPAKLLAPKAES